MCDLPLGRGRDVIEAWRQMHHPPAPPKFPYGFCADLRTQCISATSFSPNPSLSAPPTLGHGDTKQMFEIFGTVKEVRGV